MFETLFFWAVVLGTAAAYRLLPVRFRLARVAILLAANGFILVAVVRLPPHAWLLLAGTFAFAYIGMRVARGGWATAVVLAPIFLVWAVGKEAGVFGWDSLSVLSAIGFSYVVIKVSTLVKDYQDGRLPEVDAPTVASYLTYFSTFVAGPMHSYREFDAAIRNPVPLDGVGAVDVAFRALLGLVKVKVVAPLLAPLSLIPLTTGGELSIPTLAFGCVVYSAVLWLDFSGYSDLAISVSRFVGITAPENFRYPYLAPNIRDFWQRWHVTFSRVLTSYVFIPVTRALQSRFGNRPQTVRVVGYVVTFLFCGFWHGPTVNFLLWGLYHAAGLIAYDMYIARVTAARLRRMKAGLGPITRGPTRMVLTRAAAVGLTFAFVSAGWILFVLPLSRFGGW